MKRPALLSLLLVVTMSAFPQPGYKHFFIDPQPCNGIEWVRATKPTLYGTISIEITGSQLKLTVPEKSTATVFPNTSSEHMLPAGEWTLSL